MGGDHHVRAQVVVEGRVQGVWFRACTEQTARRLGLDGWVRNLADGRVEAVFEGPRVWVEAAVAWCHEGSPLARVTAVDAAWSEPRGEDGFRVAPTASTPET